MKARERKKRNARVSDLLNRASVELDLIRKDFERDYLTDKGATERIQAAYEPLNEAQRILAGLHEATITEASGS